MHPVLVSCPSASPAFLGGAFQSWFSLLRVVIQFVSIVCFILLICKLILKG
jgi:hypothetical protein